VLVEPAKLWVPLALRGVLSVVYGIVTLLWPGVTVLALALLFGGWALLEGISFLVGAIRQGRARASASAWAPMLLAGMVGIAVTAVTVAWPAITILVFTALVAVLLIGVGLAEIVLAVLLRRVIRDEVFVILAGIFAVLTGLAILLWPLPGILALTVVLGVYALVAGILLISAAVQVRGRVRGGRSRFEWRAVSRAKPHSP
jgi:uncharacterized membrane protein HdeD (DUF308 family)